MSTAPSSPSGEGADARAAENRYRRAVPLKRLLSLALLLAALAGPAVAAQALSEAQVRRFLADQQQAWNAGRLDAYFAGFTQDAVFVDQTRTPKEVISYGRSTLAQARAQARKFRAKSKSTEQTTIRALAMAPDGASARVLGDKVTTVTTVGQARRYCAQTDQTLILVAGRILSKGQTDTLVRCRPAAKSPP